jgi:hypothetical protein
LLFGLCDFSFEVVQHELGDGFDLFGFELMFGFLDFVVEAFDEELVLGLGFADSAAESNHSLDDVHDSNTKLLYE